jgi:hypothetical protein
VTGDPVSWLLIEPGWQVIDATGEDVGRVETVTGDPDADIFDGLAIAPGVLARPKYVPAEQVAAITQGTVSLSVTKAEIDGLAKDVRPAESTGTDQSLARRVASWFGLAGRR